MILADGRVAPQERELIVLWGAGWAGPGKGCWRWEVSMKPIKNPLATRSALISNR